MTFKDRWNSFLHGRFVDAPSEDSLRSLSTRMVVANLRGQIDAYAHDVEHIRADRDGALNALASAERLIATQAERLVEANAELAAHGLETK